MGFDGSRAKLRRAKEHIDALEREHASLFQPEAYRVVVEMPADRLYVLRVGEPPAIPGEQWSLLIGDCVHNLRCSLDYVAWQLAGSDPNDTETMFPIFDTNEGWKTRSARRLKKLPPDVRALIEETQPFTLPIARWS